MFEKFLEIAFRSVVVSAATTIAGPVGTIVALALMQGTDGGDDAAGCDECV